VSFYRAQEIGPLHLAQYIVDNEAKSLIGYLLRALFLDEITGEEFIDFYIKLCADNDNPVTRRSAKQYVALVERVAHFLETGEDIIPDEIE